MPSPFPGMDPYLEHPSLWPDLHSALLLDMRRQIEPQLGEDLVVRIESQLYLHEPAAERRFVGRADVAVMEPRGARTATQSTTGLAAPYTLSFEYEEESLARWLEVRDRLRRNVVTVVELLSPSNKRGLDREAYLAKRRNLLHGPVNFVEIDLLRGGRRMPQTDVAPDSPYYVLMRRADDGSLAGFWPFGLRDPMPRVPVPLKESDSLAWVDLRAALDRAYDEANYRKDAYLENPDPPLAGNDAAWAKDLLARSP